MGLFVIKKQSPFYYDGTGLSITFRQGFLHPSAEGSAHVDHDALQPSSNLSDVMKEDSEEMMRWQNTLGW